MSDPHLEPVLGSVARGVDYFGKEGLIESLRRKLKKDNILLTAPRRFGKTSAMFRLLDEPHEYRPVYIDLEHIASSGDFMIELLAGLMRDRTIAKSIESIWENSRRLGKGLRNLPAKIDVGWLKVELRQHSDVPKNWRDYGERLMSLLAADNPPVLLMLDELATMVESIAANDEDDPMELLRWFRTARLLPDTKTRFVVGSSINLVTSLERMGLVGTINDLAIEKLTAFDKKTARKYIVEVFANREIQIGDVEIDHILATMGTPIPYLLAVFVSAVIDRFRAAGAPLSIDLIDDTFQNDLLGGGTAAVFAHYRSRIDQYYDEVERRVALEILATLSQSESTVQASTLYQIFLHTSSRSPNGDSQAEFMNLMYKLENDFYVSRAGNGAFEFYSRVLRFWWRDHYGFQLN